MEATKFTEVGYHGRDVDMIIRDLVDHAIVQTRQKLRQKMAETVGLGTLLVGAFSLATSSVMRRARCSIRHKPRVERLTFGTTASSRFSKLKSSFSGPVSCFLAQVAQAVETKILDLLTGESTEVLASRACSCFSIAEIKRRAQALTRTPSLGRSLGLGRLSATCTARGSSTTAWWRWTSRRTRGG